MIIPESHFNKDASYKVLLYFAKVKTLAKYNSTL